MTLTTGGVQLLCESYLFAISKTAAEASPVLLALAKLANEKGEGIIRVTDFDLDAVNCLVGFLKSGCYEVNSTLFPCAKAVAGTGQKPPEALFTRDLLIRHVHMSGMGTHYQIPKLSEFAREQIKKVLRSHWNDRAFLDAVSVALEYKDHELHMVLFSGARSHLYSLIATDEFDPSWVLQGFRDNLRDPASKGNSSTSFELEELRKRVFDLCIERDELSASKDDLLAENAALRTVSEDMSSEQHALQQKVTLLSSEKENAEQTAAEARTDAEVTAKTLERLRKEVEEVRKSLETSEREHRVARSERDLLRVRWTKEKAKASAIAQENDTLKLTLDPKRDTGDTIPVAVRDELKQALEAEQNEVKKLNIELERARQTLEAEQNEVKKLNIELERARQTVANARG
ncbi:hypothetical protein NW768_010798 [Fusarium equiseti]|uniref:Uncharacterized protein n=1 Tax=Fusarium equiseti TaxID=61235 RepID=A0ABQ8QZH8_FUSEQ|nr:hypothetical protein NW768_010798 [Fusarium equiseti]